MRFGSIISIIKCLDTGGSEVDKLPANIKEGRVSTRQMTHELPEVQKRAFYTIQFPFLFANQHFHIFHRFFSQLFSQHCRDGQGSRSLGSLVRRSVGQKAIFRDPQATFGFLHRLDVPSSGPGLRGGMSSRPQNIRQFFIP